MYYFKCIWNNKNNSLFGTKFPTAYSSTLYFILELSTCWIWTAKYLNRMPETVYFLKFIEGFPKSSLNISVHFSTYYLLLLCISISLTRSFFKLLFTYLSWIFTCYLPKNKPRGKERILLSEHDQHLNAIYLRFYEFEEFLLKYEILFSKKCDYIFSLLVTF